MKKDIPNRLEDSMLFSLLNEEFRDDVLSLCKDASDISKRTPLFFPEYTLHDSVHFIRVVALEELIIGRERLKLLSQEDIILLILAAYFHDIGMVCDENELKQIKASDDFLSFREEWRFSHQNLSELELLHRRNYLSDDEKIRLGAQIEELKKAMLSDYLRIKHPESSKAFVLSRYSDNPLLKGFASVLGDICLSHGMSVEWIRENADMNPNHKFICYVLRLADILDFDGDRSPDVIFKSISFKSPVSLREWEKHKGVKNWSIGEEEILFTMEYEHPAYEKAARDFIDWINRELAQVHNAINDLTSLLPGYDIIKACKVNTKITSVGYEYHDLSFSLSRDEVIKLFVSESLYGSRSLFVRELLQNSLDALRLRKSVRAYVGEAWEIGAVSLRHYLDDKGRSVVECTDNGAGMDLNIIERYFCKVGRSFYRSEEFERLNAGFRIAGADFDPCSRFGIGFMSVFMVADEVVVYTRKDYGNRIGTPYVLEINGLSDLFVIREGAEDQPVGTTVRLYERNQPLAFDRLLSDNIKLVDTIESYAVACEFPIHAECLVPGIEDTTDIAPGILQHPTFIESSGIQNGYKTYEVDFHDIDCRLSGKMRQSFLVDESGHITLKNNKAEWLREKDEDWGPVNFPRYQTVLHTANLNTVYTPVDIADSPYTVACDGIAVSGTLGMKNNLVGYRDTIDSPSLLVRCKDVFVLDIRGNLKPELAPSRILPHYYHDEPAGIAHLANVVNSASAQLWEHVLQDCTHEDMPVFWSYLLIYVFSIESMRTCEFISKKVLLDKLSLPVDCCSWLKLSDVESFARCDGEITLTDKQGNAHLVCLDESISRWGEENSTLDLTDVISEFLFRIAKLVVDDNGHGYLRIDHIPSSDERIKYRLMAPVVPYSGVGDRYILSLLPHFIFNENSPIVKIAAITWRLAEKTEFERFADTLCESLFDYFYWGLDDADGKSHGVVESLRLVGAMYKHLDKSGLSSEYLPPYYVLDYDGRRLEINDEVLMRWANDLVLFTSSDDTAALFCIR